MMHKSHLQCRRVQVLASHFTIPLRVPERICVRVDRHSLPTAQWLRQRRDATRPPERATKFILVFDTQFLDLNGNIIIVAHQSTNASLMEALFVEK